MVYTMASFSEDMKRIFLAGVGAVATTAEKSKEMVDELVKKGEITVEQGKVLNEELKRDIQEKVKGILPKGGPSETAEQIAERMDTMTSDEIELLRMKLAALDSSPKTDEEIQ